MASIEVTTRTIIRKRHGAELVMDVNFVPRGSGNRNKARRLAEKFKADQDLKDHIKRVVVGASKVRVHFRASMELGRIFQQVQERERERAKLKDLPGQLGLFAAS